MHWLPAEIPNWPTQIQAYAHTNIFSLREKAFFSSWSFSTSLSLCLSVCSRLYLSLSAFTCISYRHLNRPRITLSTVGCNAFSVFGHAMTSTFLSDRHPLWNPSGLTSTRDMSSFCCPKQYLCHVFTSALLSSSDTNRCFVSLSWFAKYVCLYVCVLGLCVHWLIPRLVLVLRTCLLLISQCFNTVVYTYLGSFYNKLHTYWFHSWFPRIRSDSDRCSRWRHQNRYRYSDKGNWRTHWRLKVK